MGDFQARATREGRFAQSMAETLLLGVNFRIVERNRLLRDIGVTVNFIAEDATDGVWYFDVSGAVTSERAGLIRTDTMWKTLGRANVLHHSDVGPLMLLTTNMPEADSVGDKALRAARASFFDVIEMTSASGKARLRRYAEGTVHRPLPGFLTAPEAYGDSLRRGSDHGGVAELPVELVGHPLGELLPQYEVRGLTHRFAVMLPSRTRHGHPIPTNVLGAVAAEIRSSMSDETGGYTSQKAEGGWVDPFAGEIHEEIQIIESYWETPVPSSLIQGVVNKVIEDLEQQAAAVIIDNRMVQFERPDAID